MRYPALPPSIALLNSEPKNNKTSSTKYVFEEAIHHPSWSVFSWDGFSDPYVQGSKIMFKDGLSIDLSVVNADARVTKAICYFIKNFHKIACANYQR